MLWDIILRSPAWDRPCWPLYSSVGPECSLPSVLCAPVIVTSFWWLEHINLFPSSEPITCPASLCVLLLILPFSPWLDSYPSEFSSLLTFPGTSSLSTCLKKGPLTLFIIAPHLLPLQHLIILTHFKICFSVPSYQITLHKGKSHFCVVLCAIPRTESSADIIVGAY